MTASVAQAAPPVQSVRAATDHQPIHRDSGSLSGRGNRHAERSRLVSVGLPDLRGALGLGFDEASWIPTALNMATMFSGVFVCFLSVLFGPRRILLRRAAIFTVTSALLPFAPNYWGMLALVVIAGLASGTFYSLTMTFVSDRPSEAADHLRDCSLCGGHRFRQQHCLATRGLVYRASVLALDLLDCRARHAVDDDLRLFRNSAAACGRAEAKLARIRILQPVASPFFTARWIKGSGWTG